MIYALLLGLIFGGSQAPLEISMPIILCLVLLKGTVEILIKKSLITRTPSPYVLYLQKLKQKGTITLHPWRVYLLQVLVFGSLIAFFGYGVAYGIVSIVF